MKTIQKKEIKKLNSGILYGVGTEIDNWLNRLLPDGWKKGQAPHFSHKSTYLALLKTGFNDPVDMDSLIRSIDERIRRNLAERIRSSESFENWRFLARLDIDPNNKSPEVRLERAIINQQKRNEWANQSPVASGLRGPDSDKGRHVDLVREIARDSIYELIELKWHANNPFFAAMEILCYSIVYLLCREKYSQQDNQILKAKTIRLRVLAPSDYYRPTDSKKTLQQLQTNITAAIEKFAKRFEVNMDFCFREIPDCSNPKDVSDERLKFEAEKIVKVGRESELPSLSN